MRLTKRFGTITASLISAAALIAAGAASANASNKTPVFCNGNYLCLEEVGQSISTMYMDMWAAKYSFEGHFQLQTPMGTSLNSRNQRNYPGSGNAVTITVPNFVYGTYCATAWKWNGGNSYTKLGYGCLVAGA
jgi:hypothetical protein